MKKYLISTSIIIFVIILFLTVPSLQDLNINPFQRKSLTLRSMQSIQTIKTSWFKSTSYSYKALFPYDFLIGDPNWGNILYKNSKFLSDSERVNRDFFMSVKI
ncbi:hypothetical protein EW093_09195 [Thiospirochaeta perfilievii]|uniref:Uncharacterized protein n=1 Tax=Thiospirochaeta perfilievii TaxID=252967 RepID=A0A5C1QFA2_9SPIO|nr:hypothetical protein [Thiospirochaeta perfilievii]QEN04872.1 hypothetical protein EW093_09195 [Thiospirochaeta perfilievii]